MTLLLRLTINAQQISRIRVDKMPMLTASC
jgi:hypothetical protein